MSTKISWTTDTWNPLRAHNRATGDVGWACVRVSDGCKHCYAATLNQTQRWDRGTGLDYTVGALAQVDTYIEEGTLEQPLLWRKPRRIFVCSMTDLFGEWVSDAEIAAVFGVMAAAPQHTFQVLTKRPERMREWFEWNATGDLEYASIGNATLAAAQRLGEGFAKYVGPGGRGEITWPLPNVWLGVSVEDQAAADKRIPLLLDTPAAVRFISAEPLLGPIELTRDLAGTTVNWLDGSATHRVTGYIEHPFRSFRGLDWAIVGGESGPGWRVMEHKWVASLRHQCAAAGVAYFGKQDAGARSGIALPAPLNEQAWPVL